MTRTALAHALLSAAAIGCIAPVGEPMSQESLARHIEEIAGSAQVSPNVVQFEYDGIPIAALARNFGSSFSSDELIYGVQPGDET